MANDGPPTNKKTCHPRPTWEAELTGFPKPRGGLGRERQEALGTWGAWSLDPLEPGKLEIRIFMAKERDH